MVALFRDMSTANLKKKKGLRAANSFMMEEDIFLCFSLGNPRCEDDEAGRQTSELEPFF